jgi:hypothetical protein
MSFKLSIEFCGLCLFVQDPEGRGVGVLMPDARARPGAPPMRHADGSAAVPHVGYLRFNLANLAGMNPFPTNSIDDPPFEGVHRFNREVLDLGLGPHPQPVVVDELAWPDFARIDQNLHLLPGLFRDPIPSQQLLMRMILSDGTFTAHVPGSNWKFPTTANGKPAYQGQFASVITWSREMPGNSLPIQIRPFGNGHGTQLQLSPVDGIVQLKIANLCAENPLEWPELKLRIIQGEDDHDFKWLYRLFDTNDKRLTVAANGKRPIPVLDRDKGVSGEESDCSGGTIVADVH